MPIVRHGDVSCELKENESVLEGLLRHGVAVPHSCRAGSCGSCLMQAQQGEPTPRSQEGLKDSWKARRYFLACVCHPAGDLTVAGAGGDARVAAEIASLQLLSPDVMRVRLVSQEPFGFQAGQYAVLVRHDNLARSYSIASLPDEGEVEFHVRRIPNGRMSRWLFEEARPGLRVSLQGPSGECFYVPGREDQPMLLVGTGTGLAPLYGIVRDALRQGHRGPIALLHGAPRESGLYLVDELRALARAHSNLTYCPSVLDDCGGDFETGPIDRIVATRYPNLDGWRAFLCGDPALVNALRKNVFLAGMAMRDIYADAFLPSA